MLSVVSGVAVALVVLSDGGGAAVAAAGGVLGFAMVLVSAIDRRLFLIPDILSLPAIAAGLAAALFVGPEAGPAVFADHAIAALAAGGGFYAIREGYRRWRGFEGLGLGDVKLAGAAGAWVGIDWLGIALLLACSGALAIGALRVALGNSRITGTTALPFGSFIAPSIVIVWLAAQWPR